MTELTPRHKAEAIVKVLDDKKAGHIVALDVAKHTTLADYFVIASANSSSHIKALADETEKKMMEDYEEQVLKVEGYNSANWILMDFGNVVVHLFTRDTRDFYQIERLWADAISLDISKIIKP